MAKTTGPAETSTDSLEGELGQVERKVPAARLSAPHVVGLVVGFGLAATGAYFFFKEPEIPPGLRLKQALRWLDERRDQPARSVAQSLEKINYQDPDFAGGVAFVLGIVAFREAAEYDEETREQRYVVAAGFLREAERLALVAERRPEWAFSLGLSLYRVGSADEALPLLEEAVQSFPAGKIEASLLLAETYLFLQNTAGAEKALAVNTAVIDDRKLSATDRDRAFLQRAQILLALGRRDEAQTAVAQVSRETSGNQAGAVLRAQTCMAEGRYRDALRILKPIADDEGLDRTFPAQASYLTGLCWEKLDQLEPEKQDQLENAITSYERTVERFERSHEALAARMGAADGLRKLGRNQEALEKYAEVLRTIRRPKSFRNRWMSLKKVRELILDAWNGWVENDFYSEAIALAESMSPVVPSDQAHELAARANQRWAEHLEAEVARLPFDRQSERQEEVKLRWKRSGQSYARLAETRKASSAYSNALWTSAEDYLKGHDFLSAIEQLTEFINLQNTTLLPTAFVRRGQALMDLNRMDAALRDFQETVSSHPTDPAAFQARYLIGQCRFERSELDLAEKAWRKILESADLSPTALEWRKSLFSLGRLLYYSADLAQRNGKPAGVPNSKGDPQDRVAVVHARFEEAVARLEEYLDRYPASPDVAEARFLLAKSLQRSADLPQEKLKTAETDNARAEFRRQVQENLERAVREFQQLQTELRVQQTAGKLDDLGQAMLRNSYLELAQSYFALGRYDEAILAYTSSAGNYQQESGSLTAYIQIANCYDRLKKPSEALSTLAQAQLILNKLPEGAFPQSNGAMTRDDWQRWITWAMRLHK